MKTAGLTVLLAIVLTVTSGCLVSHRKSVDEAGVQVSPATLEQVEPGHTTEAWLLATLGEPTSRRTVDDRVSILRYNYTRETSSRGRVFLLFSGRSKSQESSTTFFEVTDGIVTRHWTEQ